MSVDVVEDRVEDAVRHFRGSRFQEGSDQAIRITRLGGVHAGRSLERRGVRASASRAARSAVDA